jgi:diguanylate cyclase (GGDEF)-like protein
VALSVIMLDLDHFKRVNDRFGHAAGDEVLETLGGMLRQQLRREDLALRFGGEEILLVLPGIDLEGARLVAERLRLLTAAQVFSRCEHRVTASFGVAGREADEGWEALLKRADQALYRAKAEGRNRVVLDGA